MTNLLRDTYLARFDRTIPAGQATIIPATGNRILCTEADDDFEVSIGNDAPFVAWRKGLAAAIPEGNLITSVTLRNPSDSNSVTVTIYIGTVDLTQVESFATVEVNQQNAETDDRATNGTATTVSFAGKYARGSSPVGTSFSRRKQITIQNLDSSNAITLKIGSTKIYSLEAGQAWTMETNATLALDNAEGAEYCVHETFYQWS